MNMSKTDNNNIVLDGRQPITSTDAIKQESSYGVGKQTGARKKGRGSQQKRFDKMRASKNQAAEADRFNALASKYGLDNEITAACSAMQIGTGPSHPSRTVEIKCACVVDEVVDTTITFLKSRKLELPETASADLKNVLRLQIRAKEILARRGSGKARPSDYTATGVERTIKHLNRAPRGIAFYLSNIGKIDYRGQMIYPITDIAGPDPPSTAGYRKTNIFDNEGKRMYIRLTPTGEGQYPPGREVTYSILQDRTCYNDVVFTYDTFDGMDELINRYRVLLNSIERKFNYLVEDIDYQDAIGTTAQLVGLTLVRDETYTAHCSVPIMDHMLAIGAGCRFGYNSTDYYHNYDNTFIQRDVNPGNFFTEIQDKKRLRSEFDIRIQLTVNKKILIYTLAMVELKKKHTAQNLQAEIENILKNFQINIKQMYSITTDNGRNLVKCVELLSQNESEDSQDDESTYSNAEKITEGIVYENVVSIKCAAHTLQLSVKHF